MTLTFRQQRQYPTLPAPPPKGPMPPQVSVIIPIARTNLVTNPSIEIDTTGYTASGGSIAQTAVNQYHGTYSLGVSPGAGTTGGAYYTIALTAGQAYALSCKFLGRSGIPYKISVATTAPVEQAVYQFIGTGRWSWVWIYFTPGASTSYRFYFTKNGSTNIGVFWVDGVQVEAIDDGELVSTYIDGDQPGLLIGQQPPAYLWTGTPHASTSQRSALTRAGGYLVNLQDAYNFLLTGIVGLGMAAPNNVSIPYTVLDGARYLRTTKPPRTISLPGRFQADDDFSLKQGQSAFRAAVDRDLVPIQQPLVLQVQPQDDCGSEAGDFAQIQCIYAGGLEGNDSSTPQEDAAPTFTMYVPYLIGGSGGSSLTVQQSVANTRGIIKRSPDGTWSAVGTGVSAGNPVYSILVSRSGKIYAGGGFTAMAGVANTNKIAYYDPTDGAWHAMGTGAGASGDVWTLTEGPDGTIYAGGDFSAMGGVANTKCIAKWNGSAWSAMGTGGVAATTQIRALMWNAASTLLYVGGNFTDIGGSGADYLATWNGSAWAVVGSAAALNGNVYALARQPNSSLGMYVGGAFTNAGAVAAADYIAAWSGSAYTALSTGMDSDVDALVVLSNGLLYAGGAFTTAGGVAVTYNAVWNGAGFQPIGTGFNATLYSIGDIAGPSAYFGGAFSTAAGFTLNDGLVLYNGTNFVFPDIDLGSAATVYTIAQAPDGTLYLGSDGTSPAIAAGITTVTVDTPGYVWPIVTIKGPSSGTSRIYGMTNGVVRVDFNLTLAAGETATFVADPRNPSFVSDVRGDLTGTIIPGSNPSLFYLAKGDNTIGLFAAGSSVTATVAWQKRYNGMADLVQ